MLPDIDEALKELRIAGELNPGPWIKHSENVGIAARNIAHLVPELDEDKAYIVGLLHDIGRRVGDDFILLTHEEVYAMDIFGTGRKHANVNRMIGDYVAIAVTDLTIFNTAEEVAAFKGVHAGYTKEEMEIPFIVYDTD